MDATLEAQLNQLRTGDETAWGNLHREHYPRLWSSVQRILENPSLSDDVVQETFIKAYREIERFQAHSQIGTWLYRIAVNQALDKLRKKQRGDRWISFFSPLADDEEHPSLLPEGRVEAEATSGMERADLLQAIQIAMSELSAEHRAVVQLRLLDEIPLDDVARMLKCKPGTVNSRLHYACQYLRQKLKSKIDG